MKQNAELLLKAQTIVNSLNKDTHAVPLDENRTRQLEHEFLALLPSFEECQSELQLITTVIKEQIGIPHFHVQALSGKSGARVFGIYVPDESGRLTCVVKTMNRRTAEFARELCSLQQLTDLKLQHCSFPSIKTLGKFYEKDAVHCLFIQTAAKGHSLSTLIEDLCKAEGLDRELKMDALKKALMKAAVALAELHLKNRNQAAPLCEDVIALNLTTLRDIYDLLQWDIKARGRVHLTKAELESIYTNIVHAVENNWGISGYCHGDPHLDNLFFDSATEQFTLIDTPAFLTSIDEKGRPIGFPANDFAWTWGSICDKGMRCGLPAEEVITLQKIFISEYKRLMGDALPPREAIQLALLSKHILFIWRANQSQEFLLKNLRKVSNLKMKFYYLQLMIDYLVDSLKKLSEFYTN